MIAWIKAKLLLDRAVVTNLLSQGLRLLTGPLTMLFILKYLLPEEQGYYYTFQSVLGLSIFLELGFGQNIVQFTAHEASKIDFDGRRIVGGDPVAISRLASLFQLSYKYYGIAAISFAILVGIGGYCFFTFGDTHQVLWQGAWTVVALTTAVNLMFIPPMAILEGFNQYAEVAVCRIWWTLASFLTFALVMACGGRLWALAASGLVSLLISIIMVYCKWGKLIQQLRQLKCQERISWRNEIWPFQWRIALSWLSGYFIFTFVIPVVFKIVGPIEAGRIGFTMQITRFVASIAQTWIMTKSAAMSMLIAKMRWLELDSIWKKSTLVSMTIAITGMSGVFILSSGKILFLHSISDRMSDMFVTLMLCLAAIFSTFLACTAVFLRSHKKEPYVVVSCVSAIIAGLSCPILTNLYGSSGGATAYLLSTFLVFPWAVVIYIKKKEQYRKEYINS